MLAPKQASATRISTILGAYAVAAGALTLIGWMLNIRRLTAWDNSVSQMPNNAIAVVAAGAGLICVSLSKRKIGTIFGAFAGVIAAATLFEHLSGVDLGIDTLILYREWGQYGTVAPGRMGVPGAISLVLLGGSIVLRSFRRTERFAIAGGLMTMAISLLSLIGYFFHADPLFAIPRLTTVAFQTSTMLFALGMGVVTSLPQHRPMNLLLGDSGSALLVRRVLPAIILLPLFLGWLRMWGQGAGLFDTAFGTAALVFMLIALLVVMLFWSASAISIHEAALQESHDRLAGMLGSISDAFMTLDADWRFVFVNEESEARIGRPRSELIGTRIWDVTPAGRDDEMYRQLHRAMSERIAVEYEIFHPSRQRWFAGRAYPTADGGLAIYSRDVTERRKAEEAIRESERKFALLFEKAAFGAALLKLPEALFVDVNEAFANMFGYTRDEIIGRTSLEIGMYADRENRARLLERLQREGFLREEEMTLFTKSGEARTILNNLTSIELGGVKHLLATIQDITERKAAEESLRRSAEALRTADRMKDEFLATLSHELRTPLTSIIGWSQMLLKVDMDERDERTALEAIRASAKAQAQLTDDILDVSRITTGKMRLQRERVDLAALIEAATATVAPAAEARNITIRLSLDRTLPLHFVDPERIQQVVWNLLSNSIKFSPPDATVEVALRREEESAFIEVMDHGRGISREFLPHVFERFRQADSSPTRSYAGLGLGLALAKDLVELHGGSIEVESEDGQGSRFTVRLPLPAMEQFAEEPARHVAAPSESSSPLTGVRVLYVDDREDARRLIATMLRHHGAEVVHAASTDEALTLLSNQSADVVVTDLAMPGRDGYDLLAAIRADHRWSDLPVLALSAQGRIDDESRAAAAGFQEFLRKPIESQDLAAALVRVTERAR